MVFGFRALHWHVLRLEQTLRRRQAAMLDSVHAPASASFGLGRIYQQVTDTDGPLTVHLSDRRDLALAPPELSGAGPVTS